MISVVVVDDSAFMRKALSTMLEKDPDIQVVGVAGDGAEGLEQIRRLNPDVVTLDIEMPRMDGLTALRHIMMEMPRPVLMISSLTTDGAEATLKALEFGAVDFIPKQLPRVSLEIIKIEEHLRAKVKEIARRKVRVYRPVRKPLVGQDRPDAAAHEARRRSGAPFRSVVAIGVSTGGPPAVQRVLASLPEDFPAGILIAQHMPAAFTGPFAKRLDGVCAIQVKEAEDGERFRPSVAYIAPGGKHVKLVQRASRLVLEVTTEPAAALYKPSADVLIASVAEAVGGRGLALIMTGMGHDGLEGVRRLKAKGGLALAQSDSTCVVYGMPKAIVDAGLADEVVDLDDLGSVLESRLYVN